MKPDYDQKEIIVRLFSRVPALAGATIETDVHVSELFTVDLVAQRENRLLAIAEVKLYRSINVSTTWLLRALEQLERAKAETNAPTTYLIVSCRLSDDQRNSIGTQENTKLIDLHGLYALAGDDPLLVSALDELVGSLVSVTSDAGTKSSATATINRAGVISASASATISVPPGMQLCRNLRAVRAGHGEARRFELTVREALEYIFAGQLAGWCEQPPTDDGLRIDIAAKIIGRHDFWQDVIRDFGARFVLFECKNYGRKITQAQIYTTEKYLFPKALRTAAVIISPKGVDAGAITAVKGAIREAGKLILWLTVDELCDMLGKADTGGEVHEILGTRLDALLLEIAR